MPVCLPSDIHRVFAREVAVRGEQRVREFLGLRERSRLYYYAQKYGMSVVVPCTDVRTHSYGLRMIGWIPDFQHVYLPQLFSEENRQYRDTAYRRVAQQTQVVMLSSHIASEHFSAFVPEYAYKARVFQFPSTYAFEHSNGNPSTVLEKFRLPAKFALIANQFWQHKNHLTVIDALQRLTGVRESARQHDGSTRVQASELHHAVPALLAELVRQGQPLTELRTRSATLEDVFVALTGRHLRDE